MLALGDLRGLVVLDEIQRRPELFLADRPRPSARFLVLGSASPDLLRQSSETLAGRVAFHALGPLDLEEAGADGANELWLRGGLPRSFVARTDVESAKWRRDFVRTFVERELGAMGIGLPPAALSRFWSMLAHDHAQIWNGAELARAFGWSEHTVRRYLDALAGTFMVTVLPAFAENLGKRQVKAPKIYLSDSGLLHTLLGILSKNDLDRQPESRRVLGGLRAWRGRSAPGRARARSTSGGRTRAPSSTSSWCAGAGGWASSSS